MTKQLIDKTQFPFVDDRRTGKIRLADFDIGMLNTLGFRLRRVQEREFEDVSMFTPLAPVEQMARGFITVPGVNSSVDGNLKDEVNVVFTFPEPVLTINTLPVIVVRRETVDFDGTRALGSGWGYYIGADSASVINYVGKFVDVIEKKAYELTIN
jgi:hypothetical protein